MAGKNVSDLTYFYVAWDALYDLWKFFALYKYVFFMCIMIYGNFLNFTNTCFFLLITVHCNVSHESTAVVLRAHHLTWFTGSTQQWRKASDWCLFAICLS